MHLQGRLLCIIYILYISIFMFQCWGIIGTLNRVPVPFPNFPV